VWRDAFVRASEWICAQKSRTHLQRWFVPLASVRSLKMAMFLDERGQPVIILREQEKKSRIKGAEARKVCSY
jgi:hypothetical protein